MRLKLANLRKTTTSSAFDEILPFSRTVRIRNETSNNGGSKQNRKLRIVSEQPPKPPDPAPPTSSPPSPPPNARRRDPDQPDHRTNEMHIQMLSRPLYQQIFPRKPTAQLDATTAKRLRDALQSHGLQPGGPAASSAGPAPGDAEITDLKRLRLPPLLGGSLESHFERIADDQVRPYRTLANELAALDADRIAMPAEWLLQPGWTHYCPHSGQATAVPFPADAALVFDIENCVREGAAPTLACALGASGWYSWVSDSLFHLRSRPAGAPYRLADLIPLESMPGNADDDTSAPVARPRAAPARLIVGHNVSYDRARIKEQYLMRASSMRFLDTMSLHVCVGGVTSYQRAMLKSSRELSAADAGWAEVGALNGLRDVHRLYWPEREAPAKELRNVFVEGTLEDIRADFQRLCGYCAADVAATQRVLQRVYAQFAERFPHAATLAGMLEIGMAYLPVTDGWRRYVKAAHLSYDDLNIEARRMLERRANRACRLAAGERWRRDVWLWDEDWSVQEAKLKKTTAVEKRKLTCVVNEMAGTEERSAEDVDAEFRRLHSKFEPFVRSTAKLLPMRRPLLPGYPAWYRGLCAKRPKSRPADEPRWQPGPVNIGTGMQVTPKLLALCWEGYPLHFVREHGWGFLVPFRGADAADGAEEGGKGVPLEELMARCSLIECNTRMATDDGGDEEFQKLIAQVELNLSLKQYPRRSPKPTAQTSPAAPHSYTGSGIWCDHQIGPSVWFFKLPHKDGERSRVGNPMAKDFLGKFADNVLSSGDRGHDSDAERVIRIAGQLSYWRNNRDRIGGQMVVWLDDPVRRRGAIVPQVVVSGTLTRRASEPTWMTASNAQRERVGSELRGMVQAPEGYRFVGADVDSQELWIAAVLGDAVVARPKDRVASASDASDAAIGCHGATPFGWMTLNGTKSAGTDMHSVTATAIGISRDHAKIINYARIYGAGQQFAQRLLRQFNPTLSETEARSKAVRMFGMTKGRRWYELREEYRDGEFEDRAYTRFEAQRLAALCGRTVAEMFAAPRWSGGTESAMFNRLEEIAGEREPRTPFLRCRLSRALEPQQQAADGDDRFLPTRINWVVQSGAVDFLHLMLVCMRWLMGGADGVRFCLSFHDEVRYLVREEDASRAALAMHVTNLLVRAFCAQRLGLADLPQSVAFFQSVEIDRVLRKESQADYATPSNPHGLLAGYGIEPGRSVGIAEALRDVGEDADMRRWPWHGKAAPEW